MNYTQQLNRDIKITKEKWQERYATKSDAYDLQNIPIVVRISSDYAKSFLLNNSLDDNRVFLEAGSGTARTSLTLSLERKLTFLCADISINALKKARELFDKHNPNTKVYFICCDLRFMPFKDGSIDSVFSDGAIEHFKDTYLAINEFYRISKIKGKVFATVPYISFGMLTYGQMQGNIPNIFILRNLLETIHLKIFKGKLLRNGYELSFSQNQIKNLFKKTKFQNIETGHFDTYNEIRFFKNKIIKNILRRLSRLKIFWPLIYVYGTKL